MKIFLLSLVAVFAFGGISVKIININKNKITINATLKKGINAIVLCPYKNNKIICARAVSLGGDEALLYTYRDLKNDAFALPLVFPKEGDEVIFAKDYSRIMIIAPNQTAYLKTKEKYFKNNTIIPVDDFAVFLSQEPTKQDFVNFAKKMNIGRFIFVLDKIYEVDALSLKVVNTYKNTYKNKKFKLPFFTSYNDYDIKMKDPVDYYKNLIKE